MHQSIPCCRARQNLIHPVSPRARRLVADGVEKLDDGIEACRRYCCWIGRREGSAPMTRLGIRLGGEPCEASEVLNGCGKKELVTGTSGTSQTKPLKSELPFEMCE